MTIELKPARRKTPPPPPPDAAPEEAEIVAPERVCSVFNPMHPDEARAAYEAGRAVEHDLQPNALGLQCSGCGIQWETNP